MSNKNNELGRAKSLLQQALSVALNSMPNDRSVMEARSHMKQAMGKLDKAQKKQLQKRQLTASQYETWWGNVQSGTAAAAVTPMSEQARNKSLSELDSMISAEQDKITELEKQQPAKPEPPTELLSE